MGNSLRCCLACVIPCGALDLIRIVHLNGHVEEMTRPMRAGEFLKDYPNYVLSKPCSHGMVRKIMLLSPHSELKRGSIYFLIPRSSLPSDSKLLKPKSNCKAQPKSQAQPPIPSKQPNNNDDGDDTDNKYVNLMKMSTLENENGSKLKSKSGRHQRRRSSRGKSGVWQPQLDSISED